MIFSRNPPLMTHEEDTPPELSPIFSFLNIHTNKVYQEGYFLKLNDQDSRMLNQCVCVLINAFIGRPFRVRGK